MQSVADNNSMFDDGSTIASSAILSSGRINNILHNSNVYSTDYIVQAHQNNIEIYNWEFILEQMNHLLSPNLSMRRDLPLCRYPRLIIEDAKQTRKPEYIEFKPNPDGTCSIPTIDLTPDHGKLIYNLYTYTL
jgi:hypothetical protein